MFRLDFTAVETSDPEILKKHKKKFKVRISLQFTNFIKVWKLLIQELQLNWSTAYIIIKS